MLRTVHTHVTLFHNLRRFLDAHSWKKQMIKHWVAERRPSTKRDGRRRDVELTQLWEWRESLVLCKYIQPSANVCQFDVAAHYWTLVPHPFCPRNRFDLNSARERETILLDMFCVLQLPVSVWCIPESKAVINCCCTIPVTIAPPHNRFAVQHLTFRTAYFWSKPRMKRGEGTNITELISFWCQKFTCTQCIHTLTHPSIPFHQRTMWYCTIETKTYSPWHILHS